MSRAVAASIAAVVASIALSGCGSQIRPTGKVPGEEIFEAKGCSKCHTVDGSSERSRIDLSRVGDKRSAEYLDRWLRDPKSIDKSAKMPKQKLSKEERSHLVDYLTTLK